MVYCGRRWLAKRKRTSWWRLPEGGSTTTTAVMARFSARLEASGLPFRQPRRRRRRRRGTVALLVVFVALLSSRLGVVASESRCFFSTTLDELGAGSHEVAVTVSNTFAGVPPADDDCPQGMLFFHETSSFGFKGKGGVQLDHGALPSASMANNCLP